MSHFAKTFHPEPEPERYEFRTGPFHHFDLPRRDFFKVLGAGIAVFAVAQDAAALHESGRQRRRGGGVATGDQRLAAHRRRWVRESFHR